jgi:glycosyltransferase EpsF
MRAGNTSLAPEPYSTGDQSRQGLPKPARVLQAIGTLDVGGAESLILQVMQSVDPRRIHFDFLVRSTLPGRFDQSVEALGSRVLICPHRPRSWSYVHRLSHLLRETGPYDVVHSHMHFFNGLVMLAACRAGVPVRISHCHSTHDGKKDTLPRRGFRAAMRQLIRWYATERIAVTESAYISFYGGSPAVPADGVFRNGIDTEPYIDSELSGTKLRKELHLPEDATLIGHIGRFIPAKNHSFLIELFRTIRKDNPNCYLVMVGEGPERPAARLLAERLGIADAVCFTGVRTDVPAILQDIDLLCLPSTYEGQPIVLLESQAAGVPSLVSDSVTRNLDLSLGLLKYCALSLGPAVWAERAKALIMNRPDVSQQIRMLAFHEKGFDIQSVTDRWINLYQTRSPSSESDLGI